MIDKLKSFLKTWMRITAYIVGFILVVWSSVVAVDYNLLLGLLVMAVGIGGYTSAIAVFEDIL